MNIETLCDLHRHYQQKSPELFLVEEPDPPATEEQINLVERELSLCLPPSYRSFLTGLGGGFFGFINVFSANPTSEYYLLNRKAEAAMYLPDKLLPFSDDYAGGLYVFKIVEEGVPEAVYYWNTDGGLTKTEFSNVLEFVARYAYEPA